jgi:hypothetical protein
MHHSSATTVPFGDADSKTTLRRHRTSLTDLARNFGTSLLDAVIHKLHHLVMIVGPRDHFLHHFVHHTTLRKERPQVHRALPLGKDTKESQAVFNLTHTSTLSPCC